ncbi:MAG: MBOAT family protein [Acetatifactor sp.]|nr:MBOAT family protein [Acetatifactor sp.]
MLFNSYVFILFFLPLTLVLYYGLNRRAHFELAKIALILMSIWFYAYFHWSYVFILLASILANYALSVWMLRKAQGSRFRRGLLTAGIVLNLSVIAYYKYLDFFIGNINYVFGRQIPFLNILMPLGISFFTFQQISWLVDSYRGETGPQSFTDYGLFVVFFPQLVAGPIVSCHEMVPQFSEPERKKFSHGEMARGIYLFSVGLFKKVILADTLGAGADWGFAAPGSLSCADTILVALIYTLQLYFDFSGYCDMACGIAAMFHLELPINFNSPYKAVSVADFWNRWHMSLTRFLTKYVYIPLGGSRGGRGRTFCNIFIVFLLSGLWHGASWTYILWGILHGTAQVLYRVFAKIWDRVPKVISWAATFLFLTLSWIVFRAESVADALVMFRNIFTGRTGGISSGLLQCFDVLEFTYLEEHIGFLGNIVNRIPSLHLWILVAVSLGIVLFGKNCYEKKFTPTLSKALGCIVMLTWSVLSLSGLSSFLYFNF